MQARSMPYALGTALLSVILTLGALSISLVEHKPDSTPTAQQITYPPETTTFTLQPSATPLLLESATLSAAPSATITATAPSSCAISTGWGQMVIQLGDTLTSIAARYNTTADALKAANCLSSANLVTGSVLYVPPVPTNTIAVCNKGAAGWSPSYIVKAGDTIYSIAYSYGVSVGAMQAVNCKNGDLIYPQEILWAPNVPTRTPYPTPLPGETFTPYPTAPLTETALPFTLTPVPTPTAIPNTPMPPTLPPTFTASPTAFP
ncbi:MAG: hypothetical protein Fur002_25670 [Anaerolineales bacterium]